MNKLIQKFRGDRSGATAIEYGLIAAFIALAMVASLPGIRDSLGAKFQSVSTELAKP